MNYITQLELLVIFTYLQQHTCWAIIVGRVYSVYWAHMIWLIQCFFPKCSCVVSCWEVLIICTLPVVVVLFPNIFLYKDDSPVPLCPLHPNSFYCLVVYPKFTCIIKIEVFIGTSRKYILVPVYNSRVADSGTVCFRTLVGVRWLHSTSQNWQETLV